MRIWLPNLFELSRLYDNYSAMIAGAHEAKMLVGIFFVEGGNAADDGALRESNPYPYDQERQAWFDGWDEAAAEQAGE